MVRSLLAMLVAAGLVVAASTPHAATDALRVCADPDNLPFSAAAGSIRGLYVDVAELVAARLGVRAEYAWWPTLYGQRAVRNTLLADRCDVFFGLPDDKDFMGQKLARTVAFLDVGYVVAVPPTFAFTTLDDLKPVTVAVQFSSPPQLLLASRDGFRMVTFRRVEEAMDALTRGDAGAAFVWGPTGGYYNKHKLGGAWRLIPVAEPGLQWHVVAGVRKGDTTLKERIDGALGALGPDIRRLAEQYGFPLAVPAAALANPFAGRVDAVPLGRSVFNQHCSHCHAPDAQSPEPSRDLRRLKQRYGDRRQEVFYATVTGGRPAQGMPPWAQVLSGDEIWQIWTFLELIQAEP